jgi:charged multivesicular body protein 7
VYASGSTAAWLASALVGRPLWWALRQAGVVGDTAATWRAHAGEYIVLPLVEAAAQRVLEHQESRDVGDAADAVYSWDRFRREFGAVALTHGTPSPEDVKVLVKFLARDRQAVVANDQVGPPYQHRTQPC